MKFISLATEIIEASLKGLNVNCNKDANNASYMLTCIIYVVNFGKAPLLKISKVMYMNYVNENLENST